MKAHIYECGLRGPCIGWKARYQSFCANPNRGMGREVIKCLVAFFMPTTRNIHPHAPQTCSLFMPLRMMTTRRGSLAIKLPLGVVDKVCKSIEQSAWSPLPYPCLAYYSHEQTDTLLPSTTQITLVWFVLDAFTHLSIEAGFVFLALGPTAKHSSSCMAFIWREYARADSRWAGRDPTILSIEIITAFLLGPLCLLAAWAIYTHRPYRHLVQLSISLCELYGGWMTFMPDILSGSHSLALHDPLLLWVHLVFMNGLWVLLPVLLAWESGAYLIHACTIAKTEESGKRREHVGGLPSVGWFWMIAGMMAVYMVLVPLILLVSADPPPAVMPRIE